MKIKNNPEDKAQPVGTPEVTRNVFEDTPSIVTLMQYPLRKFFIQLLNV
jgi:hypothetical protein